MVRNSNSPLTEDSTLLNQHAMQMELLRRCIMVSVAFIAGFSAINLSQGHYTLGWTELCMVITLGSAMWWSYRGAPLFWLRNILILHAGFLFLAMFFHGGSSELGYVWVLGFPFVACFLTGSRAGSGLAGVYALLIISFWMAGWAEGGYLNFIWRDMAYLGVVYLAFSMVAFFTTAIREQGESLLNEAKEQLREDALALAASGNRYRTLLGVTPNAVGVHYAGKWIYINPAGASMFGAQDMTEMVGTPMLDYVHPDYHALEMERNETHLKQGVSAPLVEEKLVRTDGKIFTAEIRATPVEFDKHDAVMVTLFDVSERKQYEEEKNMLQSQLEHAQRLESLGVLAGGIAHDFNNLLAAIMGNTELARMDVEGLPSAVEHLNNIENSCDYATELCEQMLAYAGKGKYVLEVLSINSIVRAMSRLIRASVSSNISLLVKLDSKLPGVEGDAAQIQQIILNFIVNSAESIGTDAGEIKVTTEVVHAKRDFLDDLYNGVNLPEGEYVAIEVKDSGCGMDDEMQGNIFDPFFTTKDTGTGLGLSAVLGIVRGHNGAIQLLSESGQGTTFRVFIPSTDRPVATRVVLTGEMEEWQGEGTVLVVDDDPTVRSVASEFVKKFHFDVITANNGQDGVNVFKKHHQKLVAVLLDMTMPRLGGVDAMREMRKIDSSVPIILFSGYSKEKTGKLMRGEQPDAFLQKPFKGKELKKCLYKVMYEVKER